jgi:threonyl-tRNA synthetase
MTQDDAHVFCRPDQVENEVNQILDLTFDLLNYFDLTEYEVMLSTRPEKAVGEDERWELATESLRHTLENRGMHYDVDDGGGAFYGPKIDIHIRDAIGRLWQCTTVQFDFNLPARFGLRYIGENGKEQQPYMIHRALLGSLERFMGLLIEHYGGAFPAWLSPVQAIIIPIAERHNDFADSLNTRLSSVGIRSQADKRNERMNAKIREAQLQKIPYMLVVGDREVDGDLVSARLLSGEALDPVPVSEFIDRILIEARSK